MVVVQENIKKANIDRLAKSLEDFVASDKGLKLNRSTFNVSFVISKLNEEASNIDEFFGVSIDQPLVLAMTAGSLPYAMRCAEFLEKKGVANFYSSEALNDFYSVHAKASEGQFFLRKEYG